MVPGVGQEWTAGSTIVTDSGAQHPMGTMRSLLDSAMNAGANLGCSYAVWHWFDEDSGVDVSTEDIGSYP